LIRSNQESGMAIPFHFHVLTSLSGG
jgi:hypothetical protein